MRQSIRAQSKVIAALGLLLLLAGTAGCENSFVGYLDVLVTDTPVEGVASVVIAVTGMNIGSKGGETDLPFNSDKPVDLLTVTEPRSRLILNKTIVPVGDYAWLRLDVDPANSYVVTTSGGRYPLSIPSHLTFTTPFMVGEGFATELMIEFNLMRSLTLGSEGTSYVLGRGARTVDLATAGSVVGFISNSLVIGGTSVASPLCSPTAYAYPGTGAVPEGYHVPVPGGTEPYSSGPATLTASGLYRFVIAYIPDGPYTLAVACAAQDVPSTATLPFSPTQDGTVKTDESTIIRF